MAETRPRPLSAREMFLALVQAGLFREEDGRHLRRISIELDAAKDVVVVHAERYADRRLLETAPLLARALRDERLVARSTR